MATRSIDYAPPFVVGIAMIRGEAVPVVDLAVVLGAPPVAATRLVLVAVAGRRVAIAVDSVVGIRNVVLNEESSAPLVDASAPAVVASIAQLDGEFLLVLSAGRVLSDEVWALMGEDHIAAGPGVPREC